MKTFTMLLKRETWEHPALWIVPGVVATLAVVGMAYGLFTMWRLGVPTENIGMELSRIADIPADSRRNFLVAALTGVAAPFAFFLGGLVFFYSLDSLYADRRDRSVLFWKSMPISDVQTVMSKLVTALVVAPLLTVVVVAAFQLVSLVFSSIIGIWFGVDGWYLAWDPIAIVRAWLLTIWITIGGLLVCLPIITWTMLASAWARKAPFLWATVPPVAIIILENMAYNRSHFAEWFVDRLANGFEMLVETNDHITRVEIDDGKFVQIGNLVAARFDLLWSGVLWEGVILAAAFTAGAIWLRRYRAEAE